MKKNNVTYEDVLETMEILIGKRRSRRLQMPSTSSMMMCLRRWVKSNYIEETIGIIEKYYIETRTTKESVSRGYIDNSNELADVYYSFDAIDWDYFRKGLKINNN